MSWIDNVPKEVIQRFAQLEEELADVRQEFKFAMADKNIMFGDMQRQINTLRRELEECRREKEVLEDYYGL